MVLWETNYIRLGSASISREISGINIIVIIKLNGYFETVRI